MRTFTCQCGARLFFDSYACTSCGAELGFFPGKLMLSSLGGADENGVHPGPDGARGTKCERYGRLCNWMVEDAGATRCRACRLNEFELEAEARSVDPSDELNRQIMESEKRRLLFTLFELGLDVRSRSEDPRGLAFALTRTDPSVPERPAVTGHADGLITLNLSEANPIERERTRLTLRENYRTVLGHFRHESGHYFWDRLVKEGPRLEEFRSLFGDERLDYEAALRKHYESPAPFDVTLHVTPYATMHPWEDFAETWAHYLHLYDTWETARAFGIAPAQRHGDAFADRLANFCELMLALNSLNRSMGQPDAYPFTIGAVVSEKLAFVERLIEDYREAPSWQAAS